MSSDLNVFGLNGETVSYKFTAGIVDDSFDHEFGTKRVKGWVVDELVGLWVYSEDLMTSVPVDITKLDIKTLKQITKTLQDHVDSWET